MNYHDVYKLFSEKECTILDTEQEFNDKKNLTKQKCFHHVRVDYIASCGHTNKVVVTNFKLRGTGILCNKCSNQKISTIMKEKGNITTTTEGTGYIFLKNILADHFTIEKTSEGCEADMLICPINNTDNTDNTDNRGWLKIQLKTTIERVYNMYSFTAVPYKYGNDVVFVFLCENDNKIWCIERSEIAALKCKLNISKVSKYDKYECTITSIKEKLHRLYDEYLLSSMLCTLEKGCLPKNIYQQREQKYIKIRESLLPEWKFEYTVIEGLSYDFIIYGQRVQEKVSNARKREGMYIISLRRTKGICDKIKKRNFKPYEKQDFDILWAHIEDKGIFYVIPIEELINHDYITTEQHKGKQSLIVDINNKNKWYSKFQFRNDNIKIDILQKYLL